MEKNMRSDTNMQSKHVQSTLEEFCITKLDLKNASLGEEYYYNSLPLCVIDAVYSIGVTYNSTRNTVNKYCEYFGLKKIRDDKNSIPRKDEQESVDALINKFKKYGTTVFCEDIFDNRQRTSTKKGILKCEAVYDYSMILRNFGVNYFEDVNKIVENKDFQRGITNIPGQKSGISLKYFFMLAGSDDLIKPDRHILNFLRDVLDLNVKSDEAQKLIYEATHNLKNNYPHITPRLLDHEIWKYQRTKYDLNSVIKPLF